jgi:hypothetical protein
MAMISLSVKTVGLKQVKNFLTGMAKDMPKIEYYSRINTAEKMVEREINEMKTKFKSPTPFILNSLRVSKKSGGAIGREKKVSMFGQVTRGKKSLPQDTSIIVGFKNVFLSKGGRDAVYETIYPHIFGGPRGPKPSEIRLRRAGLLAGDEFLVPSRTAPLNKYGNIRSGTMTQILSDLRTFNEAGYKANRDLRKAGKDKFFIAQPGGTKGIFKMVGRGGIGLKMFFLIVRGAPRYSKRFDFFGVGQMEYDNVHQIEFDRVYSRFLKKRAARATAK